VIDLNRLKTKRTLAGFILTAIVILLIILFPLRKGMLENPPNNNQGDLLSHPIYSKYVFDHTDKVINIGVQPLYLPTGLFSEAMKRDMLLQKALQTLGVEVRYYPFLKGDDVNFFLQNRDLDIGIGGDMPVISAAAKMDIVIPITLQQGLTSMVATRPMLTSQLRGKRIAYPFGSIAHYVVMDALTSEGISTSQVDLVPMDVSGTADALYRKEIDAFAVWEPISAMAMKDHQDFVIMYQQLSTGYMYFLKDFYKNRPEAAKQIVAAVVRAFRWMQNKRQNLLLAGKWAKQAGESLGAQKIPLSSKEMADLAQKDILGLTSVPLISDDVLRPNGPLHREYRFLKTLGNIPPSVTWERVRNSFDSKIIKDILAKPTRFGIDRFDYSAGILNQEHGGEK
jgi:sulfonate transport system substrate-binding protein